MKFKSYDDYLDHVDTMWETTQAEELEASGSMIAGPEFLDEDGEPTINYRILTKAEFNIWNNN